jgi:PPOX class probable F420-dependent enzyme
LSLAKGHHCALLGKKSFPTLQPPGRRCCPIGLRPGVGSAHEKHGPGRGARVPDARRPNSQARHRFPQRQSHVAPLWFIVDEDDIVFITSATSVKGRNLHANPRAALAVEDDTFQYAFVTVRGPVTLQDEAPDRLLTATRIAARYAPERAAEFGARIDAAGETVVWLRMARIIGQADLAG